MLKFYEKMQSILANNYSIFFGDYGYEELNRFVLSNRYSSIFIITDENTNEHCLPLLLSRLETELTIEIIEIEPGESMKTIATCSEIWSILSDLGADRKSVIINLGGGVITDLGGFIASTFKRGIDFINIPTTLLGMVDASVGGKNGVDLGSLKNKIGTINVPKLLVIDSDYLTTLPQNEIKSGLAEMLKHGLIYDEKYWDIFALATNENSKLIDYENFDALIYRSIEIKNEIVMQDPNENGIRKALNFGHTLGHAIESYFMSKEKSLLHGEAIAIGMILESFIAKEKRLLHENEYLEIKNVLKSIYDQVIINETDINEILTLLIHDKKNEYGKIQFVLLEKIGKYIIDQSANNEVIIKSFNDYKT